MKRVGGGYGPWCCGEVWRQGRSLWGVHVGNPFPLRDQPHDGIVQNRVYSSHGRVKRVVEADRESERRIEE